jgi:hypothetical protein
VTDLVEDTTDHMLAHALAATFTPDELDLIRQYLACGLGGDPVARLGDAVTAGRELHAAILADGAHAVGCHASALAHHEDCECWCHAFRDEFNDAPPVPAEAIDAAHVAAIAAWHVMATTGHRQAVEAAVRAAAPILLAAGRTAAAEVRLSPPDGPS